MKQEIFTPAAVGQLLNLATRTIIDRINAKSIMATKKGPHWVISAAEVERLMPTAAAAVVVPIETAAAVEIVPTAAELRSMFRRIRAIDPKFSHENLESAIAIGWDELVSFVRKLEHQPPEQTALYYRMRRIDEKLRCHSFYRLLENPKYGYDELVRLCEEREHRDAARAQAKLEEALFNNVVDDYEPERDEVLP